MPFYFEGAGRSNLGLGIDSLAMLLITHGDAGEYTARAADVRPFINKDDIDKSLLQPEGAPTWDSTYRKEGGYLRWFLKFNTRTGHVGQHCMCYVLSKGKTLRDQLQSFLRPHTPNDLLNELQEKQKEAYAHQMAVYADCKYNRREYQHEGASRPMHYKPYIRVQEMRMEMRELIQDDRTMHGGIHYPLAIKVKGICRRSEDGQARRTRGTWQYAEKMQ